MTRKRDNGMMMAKLDIIISSSHHLLLSIVLLAAYLLRVFRLDFQELRGDEAFGYFFSLRPFDDMVQATLALGEPHPVASYYVQHVWLGWVGHSEFALRYLGVLFSVLAVALLYRLALRLEMGQIHRHHRRGAHGGQPLRHLAQPGRPYVQHEPLPHLGLLLAHA